VNRHIVFVLLDIFHLPSTSNETVANRSRSFNLSLSFFAPAFSRQQPCSESAESSTEDCSERIAAYFFVVVLRHSRTTKMQTTLDGSK